MNREFFVLSNGVKGYDIYVKSDSIALKLFGFCDFEKAIRFVSICNKMARGEDI